MQTTIASGRVVTSLFFVLHPCVAFALFCQSFSIRDGFLGRFCFCFFFSIGFVTWIDQGNDIDLTFNATRLCGRAVGVSLPRFSPATFISIFVSLFYFMFWGKKKNGNRPTVAAIVAALLSDFFPSSFFFFRRTKRCENNKQKKKKKKTTTTTKKKVKTREKEGKPEGKASTVAGRLQNRGRSYKRRPR